MSTTTVNLGYVPKNRGEYSSTASYYKDNIVQYNGSSYICNPPNYDPDTAPTASITGVAPYASDPAVPNTGWAVFCNDSSGVGEGVYNVSVDHTTDNKPKVYETLSQALADVPQAKQKGGMSIKFIQGTEQSSDNKYVQFRCIAQTFTTDVNLWENVSTTLLKGIVDVSVTLNTSSFTTFAENTMKAGHAYHIILKNYNASNVDSTKVAFQVLVDGASTIISVQGGQDYSGKVFKYTVPNNTQTNLMRGRANGNIEVQIIDMTEHSIESIIRSGYLYKGIATPSTEPDIYNDIKVFYLATQAGTYTNFGGLVLTNGIKLLMYDGTQWGQSTIKDIDSSISSESRNLVENKAVSKELYQDVYNIGTNSSDNLLTTDLNVVAGKTYVFTLFSWSTASFEANKVAFRLKVNGDVVPETDAPIYSTGVDLTGNQFAYTIPSDATLVQCETRSVDGVLHISESSITNVDTVSYRIKALVAQNIGTLAEHVITNESDISELERDVNGGLIQGATLESVFIKSDNKWRSLEGDTSYVIPVNAGDEVVITGRAFTSNSVFALVKSLPVVSQSADFMTGETGRRQFGTSPTTVTVPENGYVVVMHSSNNYPNANEPLDCTINGVSIYVKGLNERVTALENLELTSLVLNNKMLSDDSMFRLESDYWIMDKFLEDTYAASESTAFDVFKTKFRGRAGTGKYQFAVISDTHGSGAYTWRSISDKSVKSCFRSIALFNKMVAYCDAAVHCGDISCDYGTSRLRQLQYMQEVIRRFRLAQPFFITKGNHDENEKGYAEADMLNLDWANTTYYVRSLGTFTTVAEDTWDGSPLYISKSEFVSDKEFRTFAQHWACPSGATWGNGAYYFYDIADVKLRIIVANSFPVNDSHAVSEDEEYLWFAQNALNLSEKTTPSEWSVLIIRHTQSTGDSAHSGELSKISNCINAFRNGTSWTYRSTTVDFGEMNGGGMTLMAHIHGHEHAFCFSNGAGYLDIGFNASFAVPGVVNDYGLSVLSIDFINKKIYQDTIDGHTWCYNYNTNKLEIAIGETFQAAKSGLEGTVVASSSDTSVATCDGMVVTAKGAGNATITVTGSGGTYFEYPITVVTSY